MALSFWLGLSIVLTVVSVLIWEALHSSKATRWFIRIIDTSPLLQMMFHFAIGTLICNFIGEGMIAGAANLTATCIFPVWCMIRLKWIGTPEMKEWWSKREAKMKSRYQ